MSDADFMRRAIDVAIPGRGHVEPNPTVGCVIARDGRIIGQGRTSPYGGPHAEPNALADCVARGNSPAGAAAYITLEPCCHTNKQTPPCAPRLIKAGVARVVVGCLDPNPSVDGGGIAMLREAGVEVEIGILEAQCRQLIAPFFARTRLNRPYVTMKWALSADGKIAGRAGRPVRITNDAATAAVHALRGRCDAIAVGTNTLVNDDPLLTARTPDPPRRPIRVVLSNRLMSPEGRRLFNVKNGPVLVYTNEAQAASPEAIAIRRTGAEVVALPAKDNGRGESRFAMRDVYSDLTARGVTHLLIEPGAKLALDLMFRSLADRAWVFRGQVTIGEDGLVGPQCLWPTVASADLDGDRLHEWLNTSSDAFFASEPSADFRLTASA